MLVTPLPTNPRLPTTPQLYQESRPRQPNEDVCRVHELNVSKRKVHLAQVKYFEDTQPEQQLECELKGVCSALARWCLWS